MSKYLVLLFVSGLLLLFAVASASAQTPASQVGDVPDATLAAMGLGGMQRLSDAQGDQVRGGSWFSARNITPLFVPTFPGPRPRLYLPNIPSLPGTPSSSPRLFVPHWTRPNFPPSLGIRTPTFRPIVIRPLNFFP